MMRESQLHSSGSDVLNWQCPICDRSSRRLFQKHGYWIRGCEGCKHRFAEILTSPTHVDHIYSDQYFQGGGAGYPDYLKEADILRQHGRRYARLLSKYMASGTILDVGSAAGFILQGFVDSGWQGRGIEPNPSMANYARTQLGLRVDTGTLEQIPDGETYDLISMIQVVGHFFDLQQAFQMASIHTNPGSFWLIETWNRESITARILGKSWHEYSPPSVLHWFSPTGLRQLANQHGFRQIAHGRPSKWLNGAHAKSLLRYKLETSPTGKLLAKLLDIIPDKMSIPYPAEDLLWVLFQKI